MHCQWSYSLVRVRILYRWRLQEVSPNTETEPKEAKEPKSAFRLYDFAMAALYRTWGSQRHSIINPSEKSSDAKCIAVLRSFILLLWPTHALHCLATCSSFQFTLRLFRYLGYPWMRASEVVVSLPAPCAEYLVAKLASPTSRTHSGPRAHRWSTRCARNRDKRISRVEQLE